MSPQLLSVMTYAFVDDEVTARVMTAGAATPAEVEHAVTAPLTGVREPKRSALLRAVELAAASRVITSEDDPA